MQYNKDVASMIGHCASYQSTLTTVQYAGELGPCSWILCQHEANHTRVLQLLCMHGLIASFQKCSADHTTAHSALTALAEVDDLDRFKIVFPQIEKHASEFRAVQLHAKKLIAGSEPKK